MVMGAGRGGRGGKGVIFVEWKKPTGQKPLISSVCGECSRVTIISPLELDPRAHLHVVGMLRFTFLT